LDLGNKAVDDKYIVRASRTRFHGVLEICPRFGDPGGMYHVPMNRSDGWLTIVFGDIGRECSFMLDI
jgi:hypothetical protein